MIFESVGKQVRMVHMLSIRWNMIMVPIISTMVFDRELRIVCFVLMKSNIKFHHSGTIQRFCQSNGTWAKTIPLEIQCHICVGHGRPVKVCHSFPD